MISLEELRHKRDDILALARCHGAMNVRVFGSVARGQMNAESDVDLLVTLEQKRSLLDHIALMQDLEDLLGCKVDVVNERALHPLLREQVLAEGIVL